MVYYRTVFICREGPFLILQCSVNGSFPKMTAEPIPNYPHSQRMTVLEDIMDAELLRWHHWTSVFQADKIF